MNPEFRVGGATLTIVLPIACAAQLLLRLL
jgi:hypothetical protein